MREGMSQDELSANIVSAFQRLGYRGDVSVQFGKWTALPHGSATPQQLREGDVVMIDDGVALVHEARPGDRQTVCVNRSLPASSFPLPALNELIRTLRSVGHARTLNLREADYLHGRISAGRKLGWKREATPVALWRNRAATPQSVSVLLLRRLG